MDTVDVPGAVYLDHAATTPMVPAAVAAMTEQLRIVGNASSLHRAGRTARRVVEESRETIAQALHARPSEVVFTSGGTEADNLAVKGLFWSRRAADPRRVRILASAVEHHAVLDWGRVAREPRWRRSRFGWTSMSWAGCVRRPCVRRSRATPDSVALVTVMWANNEVGTVQPIAEIVAIAHSYGIPVHSDAVQAVGQLPIDFAASGLDALTISGHKVGGPLGVGALIVARDLALTPVLHGGGQERDLRSGTLDTPAIAGFAAAVRDAVASQPARAAASARTARGPHPAGADRRPRCCVERRSGRRADERLPGNAHFGFPGCEGDALLMLLDARGVECSTGSACTAGVARPSHVLLAMGSDDERARGTLAVLARSYVDRSGRRCVARGSALARSSGRSEPVSCRRRVGASS